MQIFFTHIDAKYTNGDAKWHDTDTIYDIFQGAPLNQGCISNKNYKTIP